MPTNCFYGYRLSDTVAIVTVVVYELNLNVKVSVVGVYDRLHIERVTSGGGGGGDGGVECRYELSIVTHLGYLNNNRIGVIYIVNDISSYRMVGNY